MKRKFISMLILGAIVTNSLVTTQVYALENNSLNNSIEKQDTKSNRIVYLQNGEGDKDLGNGTEDSPYQNIRTALNNIKDGDTLKLVGQVLYTKYKTHEDGSALPLFINKNITIEGVNESSSLYLRTTIQLGANVKFKNMKLEIVPETILGKGQGSNDRILGQQAQRSTTIFTAGHELTLDNVNTKLGTSMDQYNERPYISGGAYKGKGNLGKKSIINIINPNSETRISAIYAGDYWDKRDMDVVINLDGKLLDTTLYTGGVANSLNGNVFVNIYGESNITDFNKTNHNGKINVKLMDGYFNGRLNLDGVNELTLEEGSRITLPSNGTFQVNDVILKNKAVIDFRNMKNNPSVRGNFIGVENTNNTEICGAVILNNDQTLDISGEVRGLARLNTNGVESIQRFKDGHEYIRANANSTGDFSIKGTTYTEFELNKNTINNITSWIVNKSNNTGEIFEDFRWVGGKDKIVKPSVEELFAYPIEFLNKEKNSYKPEMDDLLDGFKYTLKRADGTEVDMEWEVFVYWNHDKIDNDVSDLNQLELTFYKLDNVYGQLTLTITHLESGKSISRIINVLSEEEKPDAPGSGEEEKPDAPGSGEEEKPDAPGGGEGEKPDDNDLMIFDKNNPKPIEIYDLIAKGTTLESIIINGNKFKVVYLDENGNVVSRIGTTVPEVFVQGEKLIIPLDVLEYIGLDSKVLEVSAILSDGSTKSKTLDLKVIDSSKGDSSNNSIDNDSSNNDSVHNNASNGDSTVSTDDKFSSTNIDNTLPKTGDPINMGLIGVIATVSGALLRRKRK